MSYNNKKKAETISKKNDLVTRSAIKNWLIIYFAEVLELEPDSINTSTKFSEFDLDSFIAISISGKLEEILNIQVESTIMYEYSNIEDLSNYLFEKANS